METNNQTEIKHLKGTVKAAMILMIGIILIATNPSKTQFRNYIKDDMKKTAESGGIIISTVTNIIAGPVASIAELATERKNLILVSFYKVNIMGEEFIYIGVLNHFVRVY